MGVPVSRKAAKPSEIVYSSQGTNGNSTASSTDAMITPIAILPFDGKSFYKIEVSFVYDVDGAGTFRTKLVENGGTNVWFGRSIEKTTTGRETAHASMTFIRKPAAKETGTYFLAWHRWTGTGTGNIVNGSVNVSITRIKDAT